MREAPELEAADVRGKLFDALGPVLQLVQAFDPRLVFRVVVEWPSLHTQLIVPPRDGATAHRLAVFAGEELPDRGAALRAAVEETVAGIMAALPKATAERLAVATVAAQDCGAAGLFLTVDPSDETALLALALPGRSLGEATFIGAIGAAPPTVH